MQPELELNDLIEKSGLNPETTLVLRHTPKPASFAQSIPFIVSEAPELFAAYERVQTNPHVITAFRNCETVLSFIGLGGRRTVFSSAFTIGEEEILSRDEYESDPAWKRLNLDFRADQEMDIDRTKPLSRFGHTPLKEWNALVGRLQIKWNNPISWHRKARSNTFPITSISEESAFARRMPDSRNLTLRAPDLAILPRSWERRLSDWRGIYLIVDEEDGARYIGSAYGRENLLGRWRAHVSGSTGITRELAKRPTRKFRFSILELTDPEADIEAVVQREHEWMNRIHTINWGLNS